MFILYIDEESCWVFIAGIKLLYILLLYIFSERYVRHTLLISFVLSMNLNSDLLLILAES